MTVSYEKFGKILADDYNNLISTINTVFGLGIGTSGYGGNSSNTSTDELPEKMQGQSIVAADWLNLRNAYLDCAAHQDTTLTVQQKSDPDPGGGFWYTPGETMKLNAYTITLSTGASTVLGSTVNPTFRTIDSIDINGETIVFGGNVAATGTNINPMYKTVDGITINGTPITFTTGSVTQLGTGFTPYITDTNIMITTDIVHNVSFTTGAATEQGSDAAIYTNNDDIFINGIQVILSTGTTVANAKVDIDNASISGITTSISGGGALIITSSIIDLTLAEGSGTALVDLGFTAAITQRTSTVDDAVLDITGASVTGLTAINNGGVLELSSTLYDIKTDEGIGTTLSDLGFINGTTYYRMSDVDDAVTDISGVVTGVVPSNIGGFLLLSSSSVEITTDEGSGSTLSDLGFIDGMTYYRETTLAGAILAIDGATGSTNVDAVNEGGQLRLNGTNVDIILADTGGGNTLSDLGFIAGTTLREATYTNAIIDINAQTGPEITAIADGTAIKIISTVTLTLAEGTGALADMGFVARTRKNLPDTTDIDINDIIKFFTELHWEDQDSGKDLRRNDDNIIANQTSHDGETYNPDVLGTTTQTTPWASQIEHRFSVTFASPDEARAFFNTGGTIRLFADHLGDGSVGPPNEDQWMAWDDFLEYLSTTPDPRNPYDAILNPDGWFLNPYNFDSDDYFSAQELVGFTWPPIINGGDGIIPASTSNDGPHGYNSEIDGPPPSDVYDAPNPMRWRIYAATDDDSGTDPRGGNGTIITFRSIFFDQHVGTGGGPDSVTGSLTSLITGNRPIGVFPKTAPIYTAIFDLG